jgi:hypothetical protein
MFHERLGGTLVDIKTSERVLKVILQIKQDDLIDRPIAELRNALPDLSEDVVLAAIDDFDRRGIIKALRGDETIMAMVVLPSATGYFRKLQEDKEISEQSKALSSAPVFNIGTAVNAIIGTQQTAQLTVQFSFDQIRQLVDLKGSDDKAELHDLVNLLEHVSKENIPAKQGMFEKYSGLLEKHSWIASPLASLLLSWLFGGK